VNTIKDYKFIKKIYESLYPKNPNFNIIDIINYLDDEKKKIESFFLTVNLFLKKMQNYQFMTLH
jgi:spore coat polysaccharide biosynthesis protein SpsF (cytidylyltransferase family)